MANNNDFKTQQLALGRHALNVVVVWRGRCMARLIFLNLVQVDFHGFEAGMRVHLKHI